MKDLKELEQLAETTGLHIHKERADIRRGYLMSHKGMANELVTFALGQDKAFQQKVSELVEKKDVEEIHRLWITHCKTRG